MLKVLGLSIAFFLSASVFAQDSIPATKFRRNAIKIGTNLFPNKLFLSYEYALTKHVSAGLMGSISSGYYGGKTAGIYGRYYFDKYNGWFVEGRGTYSYIDSYVYTSSHENPHENKHYIYDGQHKATITYLSWGISGGYRLVCTKQMFFDFLIGAHRGKATFGKDDNYLERSPIEQGISSDSVHDVFFTTGPGNPLHFMIQFGFAF